MFFSGVKALHPCAFRKKEKNGSLCLQLQTLRGERAGLKKANVVPQHCCCRCSTDLASLGLLHQVLCAKTHKTVAGLICYTTEVTRASASLQQSRMRDHQLNKEATALCPTVERPHDTCNFFCFYSFFVLFSHLLCRALPIYTMAAHTLCSVYIFISLLGWGGFTAVPQTVETRYIISSN